MENGDSMIAKEKGKHELKKKKKKQRGEEGQEE